MDYCRLLSYGLMLRVNKVIDNHKIVRWLLVVTSLVYRGFYYLKCSSLNFGVSLSMIIFWVVYSLALAFLWSFDNNNYVCLEVHQWERFWTDFQIEYCLFIFKDKRSVTFGSFEKQACRNISFFAQILRAEEKFKSSCWCSKRFWQTGQ